MTAPPDPGGGTRALGRAVIIYDRRVAHQRALWEVLARIAQSGGPFGRPRRIAPPLPGVGLENTLAVVRPNGHAVILVEGEGGREYMIRYAP